jgi:hypothetical protein
MRSTPPDYKTTTQSFGDRLGNVNLTTLILGLAALLIAYSLGLHFLTKWDGHFHDTKGCTTIQGFHGKIFKVNSCEGSIVPMEGIGYDYQKTPAANSNSLDILPMPPEMKPLPVPKKIIPPKTETPTEPPAAKQNTYNI